MKVRTITIGLALTPEDFVASFSEPGKPNYAKLAAKIAQARTYLDSLKNRVCREGYEVQTVRIALNPLEEWLLIPTEADETDAALEARCLLVLQVLDQYLQEQSIAFCSIGCCSTLKMIRLLPKLLTVSARLFGSVNLMRTDKDHITPSNDLILGAAHAVRELFQLHGMDGCFRFTASFNCKPWNPFFPVAYHDGSKKMNVSLALECGDLLFIAFHGADSASEGCTNLEEVMRQALSPLQKIVQSACAELKDVVYGGIDASINPGLSLPDSVGFGLESLLFKSPDRLPPLPQFGDWGTLATVSAVTRAIKNLAIEKPERDYIQLCGYSGLMLPVMEDLILAERAAQVPPRYSLHDLLTYSAVCGVGLDTVPIPGDTSTEKIAGVFMEVAAMAFRLDKPLSCRLLLVEGKQAGELTQIDESNPYIVNTRIFQV